MSHHCNYLHRPSSFIRKLWMTIISWQRPFEKHLFKEIIIIISITINGCFSKEIFFIHFSFFSGQASQKRGSTEKTENNIQQRTNPPIRSRIPQKRVHFKGQTFWISRTAEIVRNTDKNLVPKSKSERQTHRKGANRPAISKFRRRQRFLLHVFPNGQQYFCWIDAGVFRNVFFWPIIYERNHKNRKWIKKTFLFKWKLFSFEKNYSPIQF